MFLMESKNTADMTTIQQVFIELVDECERLEKRVENVLEGKTNKY